MLSAQTPTRRQEGVSQAVRLSAHQFPFSEAISADGRTVAICMSGGTVYLTDVRSGRTVATLATNGLPTAAFRPDGRQLATRDQTGAIRIWNTATGSPVAAVPTAPGILRGMGGLAYSPDGRTLAADRGNDVVLWDTATWRPRATLTDVGAPTDWSSTGIDGLDTLAFAPDSRTLAVARHDFITVWDTASRRVIAALPQYGGNLDALAFTRDGRTLIAQDGGDVNAILLWGMTDAQPVLRLRQNYAVDSGILLYNPDDGTVTSYAPDGTMITWRIDFDAVLRQLCRDTAGGAILPAHWNQIAPGIPLPAMCRNE